MTKRTAIRWFHLLASLSLGAGFAPPALAGQADIEGTIRYQINGDQVTLEIERIKNNTSNVTTGTLYVTMRATTDSSPYSYGYNVARHQITGSSNGTLGPGQFFSDLRWTQAYVAPPPGTYFVHLITSQYPDVETALDSASFSGTLVVEADDQPPGEPGVDDIEIVCPCRIESTGEQATITLGVRSFSGSDSGELRLRIIAIIPDGTGGYYNVATVPLERTIQANSTLRATGVPFRWGSRPGGSLQLAIQLEGLGSSGWARFDQVPMETTAILSRPFQVDDLDILADADGDGVGDVNERSEGTDPNNSESKPGHSTIDVLALFSDGFADLYDGDPDTRIHHVITVADGIYRNSGTGVRLRLVGIERTTVNDEGNNSATVLDRLRESPAIERLREQRGADLVIMFSPKPPGSQVCGRANLGGFHGGAGTRGDMSHSANNAFSVVYGDCGGSTAAHEIGHNLGLGHSFEQNSVGTFRWSRGHHVDALRIRGTVMTYAAIKFDSFSDPDRDCGGSPCGKDRNAFDGADAVASINAVRFQVAGYRDASFDADGDGISDSLDTDDDGDGVADVDDAFPLDPNESTDTDNDGVGDNADDDDDNDGVSDDDDAFPRDPAEWTDSDGDGVGNNTDSDDDGDGVPDDADALPLDPTEHTDSDGDGVGDNADAFPSDATESVDTDGDGVGDNADSDDDGDGVADSWDLLPLDPTASDITASYRFIGEGPGDRVGEVLSAGDFDADGRADIAIGAPRHDASGRSNVGAVYVISAADLATLDAADGSADQVIGLGNVASGARSWKLVGEAGGDEAGNSLAAADLDGDGRTDLIVGATSHSRATWGREGAVYLVAGADLAAADAADGLEDGIVGLGRIAARPGSWKLVGEEWFDDVGASVAAMGDLDGDGLPEVVVGATGADRGDGGTSISSVGAVYVVASGDLAAADAADAVLDSVIELANAVARPNSWKLIGGARYDEAGTTLAATPDLDGDGFAELLAGAPDRDANGVTWTGAVYLLSGGRLAASDAADGETDGVIELERTAALPGNWKFVGPRFSNLGESISPAGDLNGDNVADLIIAGSRYDSAYVMSGAGLETADGADGTTDGVIDLQHASSPSLLWEIYSLGAAPAGDVDGDGQADFLFGDTYPEVSYLAHGAELAGLSGILDDDDLSGLARTWTFTAAGSDALSPAGDVDGDGLGDLLFGDAGGFNDPGEVHIVLAADLATLDEADGAADRAIGIHNLAGDTDGDGVRNIVDRDDDGDGVTDRDDARPLINDSGGDTTKDDDDGDGVADVDDAFPRDPSEWADADGDGIGDNADPDLGSGSGWVRDVFLPASTFAAQCRNPRAGIDPRDNQPWPDVQGRTLDENNWLRSWSNHTYLWYDEIEDRDPGLYDDPLEYFDLLRTTELFPWGAPKDELHYTYDTAEWIARSQAGESAGYGAQWTIVASAPPREAVVAYTDPDTPAADAGVRRGAKIVSIDGVDFVNAGDAASVELFNDALYPDSVGETHVFELRDAGSETTQTVALTSELIASTPVQHVGTVTSPAGATVGYMLFNDHLRNAESGLIDAIRTFNAVPGGIEDLIIDMRYNGGGYLYIASQLGYMVAGGTATAGQVFERLLFNDKHPETNPVTGAPLEPIPFIGETVAEPGGQPLPTLDLRRVFVLTGPNTCSASESIINGLRGIDIEVIQIGETHLRKTLRLLPDGQLRNDLLHGAVLRHQRQGVRRLH